MPPKKRPLSDSRSAPKKPPAPLTESSKPRRSTRAPAARTVAGTSRAKAVPGAEDSAPLHVLMVASEAHPFAKTGGLAEVTGALPLALARLGHRVTLVIPRYRGMPAKVNSHATLSFAGRGQVVGFARETLADRVTAILVDAPELFDREGLYGTADGDYADNAWRFAVFSRAALEFVRRSGERPSIIHAHDWQTGLLPAYQKMHFSPDPIVGGVPTIFTIHN